MDPTARVTGQLPYTLNVKLSGMLHARLLRSEIPHGRLLRVDASRADCLPGVVVLTRDDLDGVVFPRYYGAVIRDQPLVAIDKVLYVGDPVAAVAAPDDDLAADAVQQIRVDYEPLPAVFDVLDAVHPGAPLLHERGVELYASVGGSAPRSVNGTNALNHFRLRRGDVEQGFREADEVVEEVYTSPALQHCSLEPHVSVASWEGDALTVWSATQNPSFVRRQLADLFHLHERQVRVIVKALGGAYGSKTYLRLEPVTAALALKARRPVRLILNRPEEFVTTTKHAAAIRIRSGVTRDGRLTAREAVLHYNGGAYADRTPGVSKNGGIAATGPYRIPHVKVDSYGVYTNLPPAVPFRGLAVSQAAWAVESHTDSLAQAVGMDPVEFRLRNLLRDGDSFATGETMRNVHFAELLSDADEGLALEPPTRSSVGVRHRGRGVACIMKHMGTPSRTTVKLRLDRDGLLTVLCSTVDTGQGAPMVLAQLAAEELHVPITSVRVISSDTDVTPYDQGTTSSRSAFFISRAIEQAATELRLRLGSTSARDASVDWSVLVRQSGRSFVEGRGTFETSGGLDPETGQGIASFHWHQAAVSAEVEVDTETGKVTICRVHVSAFAGRVVNRVLSSLQNEGNATFGIAQALFEEMCFDNGQVINPNLADYMVASFLDTPQLGSTLLENPQDREIHGLGETALPAIPPAISNAVYDAVGIRVWNLPITPEKVLRAVGDATPID